MSRGLPHTLVWGGVAVAAVVLAGLVSNVWTPADPLHVDVSARFRPPGSDALLGTDQLGRDELSRLMAGAFNTLKVGIATVVIALGIGVPLGTVAALRRGVIEDASMRLSDVLLAFPALLLAISITAALGPEIRNAMIAIGVVAIPIYARLTRAQVLALREREYVTAARAIGATPGRLAIRHILPNIANALIVQAKLTAAFAIV